MGPLDGLRIVEFAGLGPAPFCGMMLADHGAEVIRIERPSNRTPSAADAALDVLARSRRSIALDLKSEDGIRVARQLCASSDGIVEGFRPGVMERLGLGPETLLRDQPRLVYGRMTGWGQEGPYAHTAGHDINYIAVSGALYHFGRSGQPPTPPINLVGDFGGGGMMLAFGMVSAILAVQRGAPGQVIDCAMTDGSAVLMGMIQGYRNAGRWSDARGSNRLDTGAHFYDTYRCSDGGFIAVGAIEPQFYAELRRLIGLDGDESFDAQLEPASWPALKRKMGEVFLARTRDEWCALLAGTDACVAPVLSLAEAPDDPHNRARGTYVQVGEHLQPSAAPRYSQTPNAPPRPAQPPGAHTETILLELGVTQREIEALIDRGVVA